MRQKYAIEICGTAYFVRKHILQLNLADKIFLYRMTREGNMLQNQAYAAYANNKINTASPAELTLMLYEGAIKFCNIAQMAIEKGDVEKAHNNIKKTENIIEEFQATLNHKYKVAEDFDNVYKYLKQQLLMANLKKDPEILDEVLTHLRTMRDTWKEVMKLTANGNKVSVS